MLGRRGKLPVLAQISGAGRGDARAWALRRTDFEALAVVQAKLDGRRVVLVTGGEGLAGPGALALASAASASGRRTALVECDLAAPRLAAELGLAPAPGLHEYLRWEARPPQILQPLVLAGPAARGAAEPLICIAAGNPVPDSAALLGSESLRHAVAKLRGAYDLVVLGGPALGEGSALEPLAAPADALLACIAEAQTSGRARRAVDRSLRRLPAPALGAVVVG